MIGVLKGERFDWGDWTKGKAVRFGAQLLCIGIEAAASKLFPTTTSKALTKTVGGNMKVRLA